MSLTLYYHPLASFCHKVLIALYDQGIEFEKHLVDLGNAAERAELEAIWPVGKFPVIRDRARKRDVAETSIIIEYLDRFYAKERPLIPKDWEEALEVRLWDRVFDNYVHLPMQQIVGDRIGGSKGDTTQYRSTIRTAYSMIDARMASRAWACGESFSLADCAAAPALFYAHTLEPFAATDKHLSEYFERLIERPSVRRVLEEAKPYFQYYPFKEALPKRFLQ